MTDSAIIFVDANTIWHRKLAEALGASIPTTAFLPRAAVMPRWNVQAETAAETTFLALRLPRGWASVTAAIGQRMLASAIMQAARRLKGSPTVVLTSPQYRVLAKLLYGRFPLIYYCADDYRSYDGWGGSRVAIAEREMYDCADFSIFVSDALRERAVSEQGLADVKAFTSPNATEQRFFSSEGVNIPDILRGRPRPILGILGSLSNRLDLNVIRRAAELPEVATLLVAGPVDTALVARETWIGDNSKILVTGSLPHDDMHRYALAMDAALIPYQKSELNYFCSPMRLYDHLASGVPIFATDACDQINRLNVERLTVAPSGSLIDRMRGISAARQQLQGGSQIDLLWQHRSMTILSRIAAIRQGE